MKVALIDADSIIHIVAYHYAAPNSFLELLVDDSKEEVELAIQSYYENVPKEPILEHVDSFVLDILSKTNSTHYLGFLGARQGSNTFRHSLAVTKPYKGQRGKLPHWTKYWKPILIEHLVNKWKFIELFNIEADDACSILAHHYLKSDVDYVVCSPDKDLRQIPGNNYDYKKLESEYINVKDSLVNLYTQCLVGDSVDNISGCPKVGKKSPLLNNLKDFDNEEEMCSFVESVFEIKNASDIFQEQLSLVKMLREVDNVDFKDIPEPIEIYNELNSVEEITQEDEIDLPPIPTFNQ